MHTYYTRNNSCAGSDIRIGSWSVSNRQQQRFCFTGNVWQLPSAQPQRATEQVEERQARLA